MRSTCATQPCPARDTLYFKPVYGGLVFAVIVLCVLLLVIHAVALRRHEKRSEA